MNSRSTRRHSRRCTRRGRLSSRSWSCGRGQGEALRVVRLRVARGQGSGSVPKMSASEGRLAGGGRRRRCVPCHACAASAADAKIIASTTSTACRDVEMHLRRPTPRRLPSCTCRNHDGASASLQPRPSSRGRQQLPLRRSLRRWPHGPAALPRWRPERAPATRRPRRAGPRRAGPLKGAASSWMGGGPLPIPWSNDPNRGSGPIDRRSN